LPAFIWAPAGWKNATPEPATPYVIDKQWFAVHACQRCLAQHPRILRQLHAVRDSELARNSHYFAGRYENLYIPRASIPALGIILDTALSEAARLLHTGAGELQLGFWFNIMQQGDVTLAHSHDDDDELLSATYYLQAPAGSAQLSLSLAGGPRRFEPVEGQFIFFHPAVEHEVSPHPLPTPRISLGLNFGPRAAD
jgi:hypothetical protein